MFSLSIYLFCSVILLQCISFYFCFYIYLYLIYGSLYFPFSLFYTHTLTHIHRQSIYLSIYLDISSLSVFFKWIHCTCNTIWLDISVSLCQTLYLGVSLRDVLTKVLDSDIIVSKFKLQFTFGFVLFGKLQNSLSFQLWLI